MKEYIIKYQQEDNGVRHISTAVKWSHDEKGATRLLLSKNIGKDGVCHFKRGGIGKILEVKEAGND
jgi:hypothetical protein